MTERIIKIKRDAEAFYAEAAEIFIKTANSAIRRRRSFRVVLSGGTTPKPLYEKLASPAYRDQINWQKVQFYFGDERFVPPTAAESNQRMVREALLEPLAIDDDCIYAIPFASTAAESAETYARMLGNVFDDLPVFDLVILGMGDDGHTASLFPETAALVEHKKWVTTATPAGGIERITLTYPVINNAEAALFLVSGQTKASVVHQILDQHAPYPAQKVQLKNGPVTWLLDAKAASALGV